jgi:hypothetical protein
MNQWISRFGAGIVERIVHMPETLEGDWQIEEIMCGDRIHEEFLRGIYIFSQ